jgi:hypothetical protein
MNAPLIWNLARWEFRLLSRGAAFWLGVLAASGAVVNLAIRGVQSPSLIAYAMSNWTLPVIPLLFLPVLGTLRRRDAACGIHELVHSRPVSGLAYVVSKFVAGWAALSAAWLASMATGALLLAVTEPGAVLLWPRVVLLSGLLVLPCFGFVTALALAVDALTGRTRAVLAVGTLAVLGSWLYLPSMRVSNLVPIFVPRFVSEVFGFDPYAGVIWTNRAWALSLTAGLLALSLWILPRRIPLLVAPGARRLIAALLVLMIAGGAATVIPLLRAPAPGRWSDEARGWEMAQVKAAASGPPQSEAYWVRHQVESPAGPVEVFVAQGAEESAEPLAQAVARVLPHFPELQPPPGVPIRVFQGSYLRTGRLESGSLVVLAKEVRLAPTADADRAVLRAMAEAYWSDLARVPAYLPGQVMVGHYFPFKLDDTWAAAAALYHQWVVLERMAGSGAAAQEQQQWKGLGGPPADSRLDPIQELSTSGAVAFGASNMTAGYALALWDAGQMVGHDRVLNALRTAAAESTPPEGNEVAAWQGARKPYWATVSGLLGVDLTDVPPVGSWRNVAPADGGR